MWLFLKKFFSKIVQFAANFQKMLEIVSSFYKVSVLVYLTAEWQNCAQRWKPISQTKCYNINGYSGIIFFQNFPLQIRYFLQYFLSILVVYFSHTKLHAKQMPDWILHDNLFFKQAPTFYFIFQNNMDDIINCVTKILGTTTLHKIKGFFISILDL